MRSFITHSVPVAGGRLRAIQWGPAPDQATATVIAVHGLTASSRSMLAIARAVDPGICLVAVDLRGRGDSNELPPPFGLEAHARDMTAVMDHLGVAASWIIGHSLGAHVATTTAALFPTRVTGLLLLDGGMPWPVPPGIDPDVMLEAVVGPAVTRLTMTFESMEAYFDFWRAHPSFVDSWNPAVEEYFRYDVEGEAPTIRPRGNETAIREDSRDLLANHGDDQVIRGLTQPIEFLRLERGVMNDPPGLIPLAICQPVVDALDNLVMTSSGDFNHYSIVTTEAGAALVAELLERLLTRS